MLLLISFPLPKELSPEPRTPLLVSNIFRSGGCISPNSCSCTRVSLYYPPDLIISHNYQLTPSTTYFISIITDRCTNKFWRHTKGKEPIFTEVKNIVSQNPTKKKQVHAPNRSHRVSHVWESLWVDFHEPIR